MVAKRMAGQVCRLAVLIVCATALGTVANAGPPESPRLKVGDHLVVTMTHIVETITLPTRDREGNEYTAQVANVIRNKSNGNLEVATEGMQGVPTLAGQKRQKKTISYRVGATVVDVLPNGVLVIEAHRSAVDEQSLWIWRLAGKVDPKKLSADDSIAEKNIDDLTICKRLFGARDHIGPI
jgi:flagellar basal body L-ring protein FlgH